MTITALDELLRRAVGASPTPAVGIAVVDPAGTLAIEVGGTANLETGEPATLDHWWDLASLTKVLVTLPEALRLVDSGHVALSDHLVDWWPAAAASPYAKASIAQLLSYDAGAPPTCTLYAREPASRSELVQVALHTSPQRPVGSGGLYSDPDIAAPRSHVLDRGHWTPFRH